MNQTINAAHPEIVVIGADGTTTDEPLSARELRLFEAVDRALRADPQFNQQCPNAVLERVESARSMAENTTGRFYLRYSFGDAVQESVQEFWGRVMPNAQINWHSGVVDVPLDAAQPSVSDLLE